MYKEGNVKENGHRTEISVRNAEMGIDLDWEDLGQNYVDILVEFMK